MPRRSRSESGPQSYDGGLPVPNTRQQPSRKTGPRRRSNGVIRPPPRSYTPDAVADDEVASSTSTIKQVGPALPSPQALEDQPPGRFAHPLIPFDGEGGRGLGAVGATVRYSMMFLLPEIVPKESMRPGRTARCALPSQLHGGGQPGAIPAPPAHPRMQPGIAGARGSISPMSQTPRIAGWSRSVPSVFEQIWPRRPGR